MTRNLQDTVAVITGASSGIGRAAALAFVRRGATVVLAARREDALRTLAEQCERLGGRALAVPVDTSDEPQVQQLAQQALSNCGRIDVWVNNAAVTLFGRFEETPPDDWRRVVETNLFGYVHGARAVLPVFREQGRGVLINVASIAGKIGQPFTSAYSASKFGIVGLSESLRQELLDAPGIHVCTVLPATIDTPLFQSGGNYMGRAAQAMPPVYDAEDAAAAIVRLAQHPQRETYVGGAGRMLGLLHRLAPGLAERMMARQVDRNHFTDVPAPPGSGNLYASQPQWASVSGGWKRDQAGWLSGAAAMLLAATSSAALGWWWLGGGTKAMPLPFSRRRSAFGRILRPAARALRRVA